MVVTTPLRSARLARDASLEQVAEEVGIHHASLSRIERGLQTPEKGTALALYRYYRGAVSFEEIFFPEGPPDSLGDVEAA